MLWKEHSPYMKGELLESIGIAPVSATNKDVKNDIEKRWYRGQSYEVVRKLRLQKLSLYGRFFGFTSESKIRKL